MGAAPALNPGGRLRRALPLSLTAASMAVLVVASSAIAAPSPAGTQTAAATSSTSLSIDRPAGVALGDVLLASVTARLGAAAPISAPSGWALVRRDSCSGPNRTQLTQALYVRLASASEPRA